MREEDKNTYAVDNRGDMPQAKWKRVHARTRFLSLTPSASQIDIFIGVDQSARDACRS